MTIDDLDFEDLLQNELDDQDDNFEEEDKVEDVDKTEGDPKEEVQDDNNKDKEPKADPLVPVGDFDKTTEEETTEEDGTETTKLFFDYLKSNNFLITDEEFEFDGSDEKFDEALNQTKDNIRLEVFGDLMERLPNKIKDAVKFAFESGGRDLDDYVQMNQSIDWDNLDLTDENTQRGVMAYYYKSVSQFDEDKINRHILRLEKAGDLEDEALSVIGELKDREERTKLETLAYHQQQRAAAEEADRKYRLSIQQSIDKATFVEEPRKQKLKNFLFNEKRTKDGVFTEYNLALSNISTNPEHMAQLADLLLDYNPSVGFDLSRFTAKAKTTAVKSIKTKLSELNSNAKAGLTGTTSKVSNSSDFDLAKYLENLK